MPNIWKIVYVKILKLVYILMMNTVNVGKIAEVGQSKITILRIIWCI